MDIKEFIENVRFGVISGIFSIKEAVEYMTSKGWNTTNDVPADKRQSMLDDLTIESCRCCSEKST